MRELEDGYEEGADVETAYELLGITAVEDLLQDNVATCIQDFMKANIKVWMLTGDKGATAQQIGKTCGIFDRDMQIYEFSERQDAGLELIRLTNLLKLKHTSSSAWDEQQDSSKLPMLRDSDGESIEEVATSFGKLQNDSRGWSTTVSANCEERKAVLRGLLICGASLPSIFRSDANALAFSQILSHMRSIIVYRSSPSQKAEIVKFIRNHKSFGKPITAAIGDGANDVNMIQSAHIGFGIQGNEGNQASSFSDYALTKYEDLRRLLFWHGRGFAWKASNFTMWFVFKGMLFSIPILFFNTVSGFSGLTYVDDLFFALYEVILTTFAIYFYLLLDQDVSFKDGEEALSTNIAHLYTYKI